MIVVVFEVWLNERRGQEYFDLAGNLRPLLDDIDGFISVERFQSLVTENKFVSISFWRDEEAVAHWRTNSQHEIAQSLGKKEIFENFRISVAAVERQYDLEAGD